MWTGRERAHDWPCAAWTVHRRGRLARRTRTRTRAEQSPRATCVFVARTCSSCPRPDVGRSYTHGRFHAARQAERDAAAAAGESAASDGTEAKGDEEAAGDGMTDVDDLGRRLAATTEVHDVFTAEANADAEAAARAELQAAESQGLHLGGEETDGGDESNRRDSADSAGAGSAGSDAAARNTGSGRGSGAGAGAARLPGLREVAEDGDVDAEADDDGDLDGELGGDLTSPTGSGAGTTPHHRSRASSSGTASSDGAGEGDGLLVGWGSRDDGDDKDAASTTQASTSSSVTAARPPSGSVTSVASTGSAGSGPSGRRRTVLPSDVMAAASTIRVWCQIIKPRGMADGILCLVDQDLIWEPQPDPDNEEADQT